MTLTELRQKRAALITQAQEFYTKAQAENREQLTAEEKLEFDKRLTDIDSIDTQIRAIEVAEQDREKLERLQASLSEPGNRRSAPPGGQVTRSRRGVTPQQAERERVLASDEYRDSFFDAVIAGETHPRQALRDLERRGFVLGTDAAGGYMVLPTALRNDFLTIVDELCDLRQISTVIEMPDAKALGVSKIPTRPDDADWTTEVQSITLDTGSTLGRRDLTPFLLTKAMKASIVLLARSPMAEPILVKQLARSFAMTYEKAFLTGSGSAQPLGVFTPSSSGVSTARDVTTASTTTPTYGELITTKYSLKAPYLASKSCSWVFHRLFMALVLGLKDSQNRPIFIPSGAPGLQDTLLGTPVRYSEFAPHTYTAGLYAAAIGDFAEYYIVDTLAYSVQRLNEKYADTNEVGFYGRNEVDASPMLEEAFARIILHA